MRKGFTLIELLVVIAII
ncbi:MAG: prepilin-type N-terminal cleavage/methylation domain-containing protein [Armatimonadota bacterium]